jgi:3-hydroxymyristoyl/3-hydroxydecanoyl-(acyl carrier protein) dehydratase
MSRADPAILQERLDGDECALQLRIPDDLAYFPGHFPQAPVLPGAVQIAWALQFAASRLGTSLRCREMEALKFQRLLQPGDTVTLALRLDRARGKLHFAYREGDVAYSSGRLVLEPNA